VLKVGLMIGVKS